MRNRALLNTIATKNSLGCMFVCLLFNRLFVICFGWHVFHGLQSISLRHRIFPLGIYFLVLYPPQTPPPPPTLTSSIIFSSGTSPGWSLPILVFTYGLAQKQWHQSSRDVPKERTLFTFKTTSIQSVNKGGKFLKKLWCCVGGRI